MCFPTRTELRYHNKYNFKTALSPNNSLFICSGKKSIAHVRLVNLSLGDIEISAKNTPERKDVGDGWATYSG